MENEDILSGDECRCLSCSAIMFMPFSGKYIPINQKQFDELFYPNSFLKHLLDRSTKSVSYVYPTSFRLK